MRAFPVVEAANPMIGNEKDGDKTFSIQHPKLVIHFDVNETILIEDAAGGDTRDDCFNKLLAKSAFVRKPDDPLQAATYTSTSPTPTQWWDGTQLTVPTKKVKEKAENRNNKAEYLNSIQELTSKLYGGEHWEWPEGCFPYYKALKGRSKTFTEHHGHIFQPLMEEMKSNLEFDADIFRIDPRLTTELCKTHQLLLPAFFYTLNFLEQSGRDYTVVIRTFGHDLIKVANAIDAFREGKHPLFPFEGGRDSNVNNMHFSLPRKHMFRGRYYDVVEQEKNTSNHCSATIYRFHQWNDDDEPLGPVVANNDDEILKILEESDSNSSESRIFGINDDYPFWSSHQNHPEFGKPVWVHSFNRIDTKSSGTQTSPPPPLHIMFDDNIKNDPFDSIVAIRVERETTVNDDDKDLSATPTPRCFRSLPGPEIQSFHGIHLVRVPTFKPILDKDWFIEQIKQCESMYLSSLYS